MENYIKIMELFSLDILKMELHKVKVFISFRMVPIIKGCFKMIKRMEKVNIAHQNLFIEDNSKTIHLKVMVQRRDQLTVLQGYIMKV